MYTKLKYIWVVQKLIASLFYKAKDTWKKVLIKSLPPSLFIMPHIFLLALTHWFILAIIGVRIYVDNFSKEIGQEDGSETGAYKVAS